MRDEHAPGKGRERGCKRRERIGGVEQDGKDGAKSGETERESDRNGAEREEGAERAGGGRGMRSRRDEGGV